MTEIIKLAHCDNIVTAVRFDGGSEGFIASAKKLGVKKCFINRQIYDEPILIIPDGAIRPPYIARRGDYVIRTETGAIVTETAEEIEASYREVKKN